MATRKQAAREFVKTWSSDKKGREDADRQTFWNDLLQRIYGINNYYDYITYEKDVQVKADGKVSTRRIDGYIPSTKVMIEMKGKNVTDLSKPLTQSGGDNLTPFEQAKRYANFLPASEYPRWIVVSNFNQIDIHDMNKPLAAPTTIKLTELPDKFKQLEFMVDANQQQVINEKKLSVDAGNLVAKIYDSLHDAYAMGNGVDVDSPRIQQSLNMLIVRLVFLMYADDTGILGQEDMFQNFIERRPPQDIRQGLIELFKVLDQDPDKGERDPYIDEEYNQFSYVNGGMFSDENIVIPQFTPELKDLIVNDAGKGFNWSNISPTIFGAVFESTLNPETRRSGGMHYTSIENIHKVIDPLFLNDLHEEFDKIQNMGNRNQRITRAKEFQEKLGKLKFLDPACGSGNFLTETYLSLRKMENQCLQIIYGNQPVLATEDLVKVQIQNFYGIEINDFAVSVARTAMWIAENQMLEETKDTVYYNKNFLPLDSNDSIYEGNALRIDWNDIVKPYELNYIMGNPPFVGYSLQSKTQKKEQQDICVDKKGKKFKASGKLDYVSNWFVKAAKYIDNSTIHVAFVSTNSITQGEQVTSLWEPLICDYNIRINFAVRTFKWNNEAKKNALVYVVIIGFSNKSSESKEKFIFDGSSSLNARNINPYLIDFPNIFVHTRTKPICNVQSMISGNRPADGGNLIIEAKDYKEFIQKEPKAKKYIKRFMMGNEFIKGKKRYCLWLVDVSPAELRSMPLVMKRVEKCREDRMKGAEDRKKLGRERPHLFRETRNPKRYIAIPVVSGGNRKYIPMGYLDDSVIPGNKLFIIEDASLYSFGVLTSIVHMYWEHTVDSKYGPSYQYAKKLAYNNFPWPEVNDVQKQKISEAAQAILDARNLYPDSSLADLYDPLTMPIELRKAHEANDKAVLKAYGLKPSATETEIIQHLFKMYEGLTKDEKK